MNRDRVRRYVERHDDATVPQVLGRFELPPSAAGGVREVIESPDVGEKAARPSEQDLYRQPITTPPEGRGRGPSPPSDGGVIGPYNGSEAEVGEK